MRREPLLAVVVCTHERPDDLERCLAALARLEDPVETVVVDSASRPPCRELVERWAARIPRLAYRRVERPGLSVARNAGVAATRAPIVAFVDDDAAPRPDWARRLAAAFDDPSVGCAGGACVARFAARRPRWLSDRLLAFAGITHFGDRAREARSSAEWPFGANMAFRREALAAAGGFSEALGRDGRTLLSGEDSAMVEAVRDRGWRVWLEPGAVVDHTVHPERCVRAYYWRRLWWNGRTRAVRGGRRTGLRLLAASPVRLALFLVTRDRVYLYRLAEAAGYAAHRARAALGHG